MLALQKWDGYMINFISILMFFIALDFILLLKILAGFGITVTFSIATNNQELFSSSVEGLQP